jgi:hypothetical protein
VLVIYVDGAEELRRVAAAIRLEGRNPQVANDITNHTHRGGPAIRAAFKAHATAVLPHSGGLNRWVASSRMTFRKKRGALTGGMTVRVGRNSMSGRAELEGLDDGLAIHPLYGRRRFWYHQGVAPDSISEPIEEQGGKVLYGAVVTAAEGVVARIEASG